MRRIRQGGLKAAFRILVVLELALVFWPVAAFYISAHAMPASHAPGHSMTMAQACSDCDQSRDCDAAVTCQMHCVSTACLPIPAFLTVPDRGSALSLHPTRIVFATSRTGPPPRRPPKVFV